MASQAWWDHQVKQWPLARAMVRRGTAAQALAAALDWQPAPGSDANEAADAAPTSAAARPWPVRLDDMAHGCVAELVGPGSALAGAWRGVGRLEE